MAHCDSCGSWVSDNYYRVFANNNGALNGCLKCGKRGGQTGTLL